MDEVFINGGAASARLYLEAANPTQQDVLDSNGGRNPRIMLPNGRRTTAVVIKPAADAFVNDEGDVTAVYTEEPLPGVCHTIAADGAGATTLHGRDSVSSTPTPGPYLAAQNLPIGSYAADGVNLATLAVERGDYSCAMVSATVDTSTGMVHDSQDGDQADLPPDVETGKGGKEPDKTTSSGNGRGKSVIEIEDWLDKHGDGYTAGTPEEERKRIRDRLQEWIEWIANYADMGSQWNADNWWKLLFRLSDAKRAWTSILERTARPKPSNVDKRTMTKEDWATVLEAERILEDLFGDDEGSGEEEDSWDEKIWKWGKNRATGIWGGAYRRLSNPVGSQLEDMANFFGKSKEYAAKKDMHGNNVGLAGGAVAAFMDDVLGVKEMGDGAEKFQSGEYVDGGLEFIDGAEKYGGAVGMVTGAAGMRRAASGQCFVAGTMVLVLADGADPALAENAMAGGDDPKDWCMLVPIESIRVGDRVLARDEHNPNAPMTFSIVEATFETETDALVDVDVVDWRNRTGGTIRASIGHPFWVVSSGENPAPLADVDSPHFGLSVAYKTDSKGSVMHADCGWVFAKDLRTGYTLDSVGTATLTVARADFMKCQPTTVYNFRVSTTHSYFVASTLEMDSAVWVHNINAGKAPVLKGSKLTNRIKAGLEELGFDVRVNKVIETPLGRRIPDLAVYKDGKLIGFIECKNGKRAYYSPAQRSKDAWISRHYGDDGVPVALIHEK